MDESKYLYLTMMDELLTQIAEYVEGARQSDDYVKLGVHLGLTVRTLRLATEIYRDHLCENHAEMEQGENDNEALSR